MGVLLKADAQVPPRRANRCWFDAKKEAKTNAAICSPVCGSIPCFPSVRFPPALTDGTESSPLNSQRCRVRDGLDGTKEEDSDRRWRKLSGLVHFRVARAKASERHGLRHHDPRLPGGVDRSNRDDADAFNRFHGLLSCYQSGRGRQIVQSGRPDPLPPKSRKITYLMQNRP